MALPVEAIHLRGILESDDISSLSDGIKTKLENHLIASDYQLSEIKEELAIQSTTLGAAIFDSCDVVAAQLFTKMALAYIDLSSDEDTFHNYVNGYNRHECEELQKQLGEKENRLLEELDVTDKLKNEFSESERKNKEVNSQLFMVESSLNKVQLNLEKVQNQNQSFSDEKSKLISILEDKEKDLNKLNNELNSVSEQLSVANKNKYEILIQSEELKSREITLQYQEKRLQQQLELANNQNELLNAQISEKNQQILNFNSEKTAQIIKLQTDLDSKIDELNLLQGKCENVSLNVEKLEKISESKSTEIYDLQTKYHQTEQQFQQELNAQMKLTDLYKKSSEEHLSKVNELMKAVEELQNFVEKSANEYEDLEKKFNENIELRELEIKETDQKIIRLESELENANKLLNLSHENSSTAIEQMYPEAATTSKFMKSGKSLTALYTDFTNVQQQLLEQQQENDRLKQYLENVLKEFEDKAPLLVQQKEDYEKALSTITALNIKLDCAITDREKSFKERDDMTRRAKTLNRENIRLKQELLDLSSQVRLLLKEVEICRGNYVAEDNQQVSSSDESSSSKVISKHLVTFRYISKLHNYFLRNIEELQKQNSQLLKVIRELSEEQENKEKSLVDESWNVFSKSSEELTAGRNRQETILESVVRQRDMYKTLLTETGMKADQSLTPLKSPKISSSEVADLTLVMNQMKSEEKRMKEESGENMKILAEQLENSRTKAFESKLETGRATSQLEMANNRIDALQTRLDGAKKEVDLLQNKNFKQSNIISKQEEAISSIKQELLSSQSKLSRLEVSHENLNNEHNLLKNREEILLHEKETLRHQSQSQRHVLSNLQSLQANLERAEAERKLVIQNQVDKLERENGILMKKVDDGNQDFKKAVNLWEKKLEEMQLKLNKQIEIVQGSHADVSAADAQIKELKEKLKEAETQIQKAQDSIETSTGSRTDDTPKKDQSITSEIDRDLVIAQTRISELSAQLALKEESLKGFKNRASELETCLKEMSNSSAEVQEELEKKISSLNETIKQADDEKHELNIKNQELFNEVQELQDKNRNKDESALKELMDLKIQYQNAKECLLSAEKNLKDANADASKCLQEASQAREKYEREVMLNASNIQELTKIRKQLEERNSFSAEYQQAAEVAKSELSEMKASWQQQEQIMNKNIDDSSKKVNELENQNTLLHEQIELMNTQINALKSSDESMSMNVSFTGEEKTNEKLLDVIRFLRKEKELLSAQFDVEKAENIRMQAQLKHGNNKIVTLQQQIQDLQKKSELSVADSSLISRHHELMKKIEMLKILEESNSLLRQEKEALDHKVKNMKTKIEDMQKEMDTHERTMSEISSDKESATIENTALRAEIKRWQDRVQQLTAQVNKFTPADLRNMNEEIDNLRKKTSELSKENEIKINEISRLESAAFSIKRELEALQNKTETDKKEIVDLKETIKNRPAEKELVEKKKVILQVKDIAKKYKKLYHDELTKTQELTEAVTSSEKSLNDSQERLKQKEQRTVELENEIKQANVKVTDASNKVNELEKMAEEVRIKGETVIKEKSNENQKLQEKIKEFSEELIKTKIETEKIVTRVKKITSKSNAQINLLKGEKEKMTSDIEEHKLRLSSLQSQHEHTVARLQKEIESLKQNLSFNDKNENLRKQIEDLTSKVALQSKQLSQQQQNKPSTSAGPVVTAAETRTANIKPMASPASAPSRHIPPQRDAGPSSTVQQMRTHTPTASIRPMAIGSTSSTVTRTATVMPTTPVSATVLPQTSEISTEVQGSSVSPSLIPAQGSSISPPLHLVQGSSVSPPLIPVRQATVTPTAVHSTESVSLPPQQAPTVAVLPNVQETLVAAEEAAIPEEAAVSAPAPAPGGAALMIVPPHMEGSRSVVEPHEDKVIPSTSASRPKRQRDDSDTDASKRAKVQAQVVISSEVTGQPAKVLPSIAATVLSQKQQPTSATQPTSVAQPSPVIEEEEEDDEDEGEEEEDDDDDDVIVVESDAENEEDQEDQDENQDEEESESEDVEEVEEVEEIEVEEDMEDEPQFEGATTADEQMLQEYPEEEEEMNEVDENDEGDNEEYEITDMDEQSNQQMESSSPDQDNQQPREIPQIQEPISTSQLQPDVSLISQGQGYEEGDDSIVPSTPTLLVPRRTDGFAEAVSSPQVPQGRFVFSNQNQDVTTASTAGGNVSLATQGALGVEDTRMDVLQFDEGSGTGRSVPTTPLQVSPPCEESNPEVVDIQTISRVPDHTGMAIASTSAVQSRSQKRKVPENGDVSRKTARCSAQQVAAILESDDEETLGFDEDYPSDELKTDSDDNVENDNDSESDSDNENPVDRLPVRPVIGHNLDSGWNKKIDGGPTQTSLSLGDDPAFSQSDNSNLVAEDASTSAEISSASITAVATTIESEPEGGQRLSELETDQSRQARRPIVWDDSGRNIQQGAAVIRGSRGGVATRARRIRIRGAPSSRRARFGRGRPA
ncbi:Nucleoprotein TPR [Nymphon striatum]|nr:Nucleoprotein TPR [Nymphon striatum]